MKRLLIATSLPALAILLAGRCFASVNSDNVQLVALCAGAHQLSAPSGDGCSAEPTPGTIQAVAIDGTTIDFSLVSVATGGTSPYTYRLLCATSINGAYAPIVAFSDIFASGEGSIYSWTGAAASTTYYCRPQALDDVSDQSIWGTRIQVTTPSSCNIGSGTDPVFGTGASSSNITSDGATISWGQGSDAEDMASELVYNIGRGDATDCGGTPAPADPTNWTFLSEGQSGLSYADHSAAANSCVYYRVNVEDTDCNLDVDDRVYAQTLSAGTPDLTIEWFWDFEQEPLGAVPDSPATVGSVAWRNAQTSGSHRQVTIENSSPLYTGGGKYMRTWCDKFDDQVFRCERVPLAGYPGGQSMSSVGGGDWTFSEFWVGSLKRFVSLDVDSRVHVNQWFAEIDTAAHPERSGWNPQMSLFCDPDDCVVYVEQNPQLSGGPSYTSPVVLDLSGSTWSGQCHQIIWRVKIDTRSIAEGAAGQVTLYIDGTQVFDYSGQVFQADGTLTGDDFNFRGGTYLSSWRTQGTNGDEYELHEDNFLVATSVGGLSDMQAVVGSCD